MRPSLFALTFLSSLLGCDSTLLGSGVNTVVVSGTVAADQTGEPIEGAVVRLYAQPDVNSSSGVPPADSDVTGPDGAFTVTATVDGICDAGVLRQFLTISVRAGGYQEFVGRPECDRQNVSVSYQFRLRAVGP